MRAREQMNIKQRIKLEQYCLWNMETTAEQNNEDEFETEDVTCDGTITI